MELVDLKAMGESIWKTLEADRSFQAIIPEGDAREVFAKFARTIPELLGEQLSDKLTYASFAKAKATALKAGTERAFLERLYGSYPKEEPYAFTPSDIEAMIEITLRTTTNLLGELSRNADIISKWMQTHKASEERAFAHFKWSPLCDKAMDRFRTGTLTVGEFLELQPWTLLGGK